ncbi:MAG: monovalent cation:H+ antiporter-2, family, partial [Actinomycetota bacterium]
SADFISLAAEIGVLLLLLALGLDYSADELRRGLGTGIRAGVIDAVTNFAPGFAAGLLLGWGVTVAVLLGGVCWVSSSGVTARILGDFGWTSNPETPGVLNLLVFEDLAMAAYLPVVAALVARRSPGATALTVAVALGAVAIALTLALRWGVRLSRVLAGGSDESLLLSVFGLTLLVGGLAQQVHVSAAVGAFLVGLALSGSVQSRAGALITPLRDLFAATFFLFFSFQIDVGDLSHLVLPAALLTIVTGAGKLLSGRVATASLGVGAPGRLRAGTALLARGEFSVVIASLGADTGHGSELAALAGCYVLMTAIVGPLAAKFADRRPVASTA